MKKVKAYQVPALLLFLMILSLLIMLWSFTLAMDRSKLVKVYGVKISSEAGSKEDREATLFHGKENHPGERYSVDNMIDGSKGSSAEDYWLSPLLTEKATFLIQLPQRRHVRRIHITFHWPPSSYHGGADYTMDYLDPEGEWVLAIAKTSDRADFNATSWVHHVNVHAQLFRLTLFSPLSREEQRASRRRWISLNEIEFFAEN